MDCGKESNVTPMLSPGSRPGLKPIRLLLDVEPQRPGEDEVATGSRLPGRAIPACPRAFDLVLADALYTTAALFDFLLSHRKHALVVLKDERRNIFQDVAGLLTLVAQYVPADLRTGCGVAAAGGKAGTVSRNVIP